MATTLPVEVLDAIIDSLASEDDKAFSSVKACSLVSRKFLPRTRSHIFNSIHIYSPYGSTPLMFARLISQNPEIAYYVISLKYFPMREDADLANESFATALSSLTRLKRLIVHPRHILWKDLPFRETIVNLMHLPTLSYFELNDSCGFHVSDLALCTGLKSLVIFDCARAAEQCEDVEIYPDKPPRLESYVESYIGQPSGSLLKQLCTTLRTDGKPIIDITGLKKMFINLDFDELDALTKSFKLCTQLTDVHLSECQNVSGFENLFLGPLLQTLQHIHLDFSVSLDENPLPPFISGFASFASKNIIQTIRISIEYFPADNHICGDEWGALDRVFTQSESSWRSLQFFSLHFIVVIALDEDVNTNGFLQDLHKLPETQLRGLMRSRDVVLDFDVSTERYLSV